MSAPKTPPLLLGATLAFWGWQSGFTGVGLILALIIELPRFTRTRWEISDDEFGRIWTFCTLLLLSSVVYAFTLNEGPSRFADMFQDPGLRNQTRAGVTSARTAAAIIRWLPMLFFLFVAAQEYSSHSGVPLTTVSLIMRRRWKKAKKEGKPPPPNRYIDVSYLYFVVCLFSSSIQTEKNHSFFWGAGALLMWGLFPLRSRRFSIATWAGAMLAAVALAWAGQFTLSRLQQYIEALDPQWLSSFRPGQTDASQTKTSLGQIGRIQNSLRIVIRVEAKDGPVPDYLREASYNEYRRTTWHADGEGRDFDRVDEEPPGGNFPLVPAKKNIACVEVSCFLPGRHGLLPLPLTAGRLTNLAAFFLEKNAFGAVHAQGPGLVIFDAMFGPGPVMDSAPTAADLSVPQREQAALDAIIQELELAGKPHDVVLKKLEQFFSTFEYSLWQERPRHPGEQGIPPLTRFLLRTRKGHCEYFATATVLILHRLDIPARYAVGYMVHERAAGEGKYVVRERDAHAWCMVWDSARSQWRDFDTTPASWAASRGSPGWRRTLSDAWSRVVFEVLRIRWGQTRLREYILWVVVPILILLFAQIVFSRRRRAHRSAGKSAVRVDWPGLDSEFYELEKRLEKKGFIRQPAEPVTQWMLRGAQSIPSLRESQDTVRGLLRLHYRYRFDPEGINEEDRELLRKYARQLIAAADGTPRSA